MLYKILNVLNNPITALIIILIFCLLFFLYNGIFNKTHNNFLSFGPTKDETDKPVYFLGAELNSWNKVIITYIFIFFAAIFTHYYENVMEHNIYHYLTNYSIINIKSSKLVFYISTFIDPFIKTLLYIIEFYAAATFQIQYIIPQFIGSYIIGLPFIYHLLKTKKFV